MGGRPLNYALDAMEVADDAIAFLREHAGLLSPSKQRVAQFVCENWPLSKRLPRSIAQDAYTSYGFTVNDIESSQRVARELFLEVARIYRESGSGDVV